MFDNYKTENNLLFLKRENKEFLENVFLSCFLIIIFKK